MYVCVSVCMIGMTAEKTYRTWSGIMSMRSSVRMKSVVKSVKSFSLA